MCARNGGFCESLDHPECWAGDRPVCYPPEAPISLRNCDGPADPCAGVECPPGSACENGECVNIPPDLCADWYYQVCDENADCQAGYQCGPINDGCTASSCQCNPNTGGPGVCTRDCLVNVGLCEPCPGGDCGPPPPAGCQDDADCAAGTWCRETQNPNLNECVAYQAEGQVCGGFLPPWARNRCDPEVMECTDFPMIPDAPGRCRLTCADNRDCQADQYCAESGHCRDDGACGEVVDCGAAGNEWNHPFCVGNATCNDGQCGWVCGRGDPREDPREDPRR
jgi:hypothetical protein